MKTLAECIRESLPVLENTNKTAHPHFMSTPCEECAVLSQRSLDAEAIAERMPGKQEFYGRLLNKDSDLYDWLIIVAAGDCRLQATEECGEPPFLNLTYSAKSDSI